MFEFSLPLSPSGLYEAVLIRMSPFPPGHWLATRTFSSEQFARTKIETVAVDGKQKMTEHG